jgi:hypothetical protein
MEVIEEHYSHIMPNNSEPLGYYPQIFLAIERAENYLSVARRAEEFLLLLESLFVGLSPAQHPA